MLVYWSKIYFQEKETKSKFGQESNSWNGYPNTRHYIIKVCTITSSKFCSDFNHIAHFTQIQSMLHPGTDLNSICGKWKIVKVIKSKNISFEVYCHTGCISCCHHFEKEAHFQSIKIFPAKSSSTISLRVAKTWISWPHHFASWQKLNQSNWRRICQRFRLVIIFICSYICHQADTKEDTREDKVSPLLSWNQFYGQRRKYQWLSNDCLLPHSKSYS